jgi:Tfp pilus assembly protein PilX
MSVSSRQSQPRRGFALLAVLWVLSGIAVLTVLLETVTSDALGASGNRTGAIRAAWTAEGCLAEGIAGVNEALAGARDVDVAWSHLDDVTRSIEHAGPCKLMAEPAGLQLDVNTASPDRLYRLFVAAGWSSDRADSLAAAINDWRDEDDLPSPLGAEAEWYRARGRATPRNGELVGREELRRVRGLESMGGLDTLLTVEPGRILLSRAPAAALATIPGLGPEAIATLLANRSSGEITVQGLMAMLSPDARSLLQQHLMGLSTIATLTPDAWIVTASAARPGTARRSRVEVRLIRAGRRAAIMRHRSLPWS